MAWASNNASPMPIFIYNLLQSSTHVVAYAGTINNNITSHLIAVLNKPSKKENQLTLFITECFQNLVKHAVSPKVLNPVTNTTGFFTFRESSSEQLIFSTNTIHSKDVMALKEKLETINALSTLQLKELEATKLQDGIYDEKGGAGLGLIKLAIKSKQKIEYLFNEVDANQSLFYQQLNLIRNNSETLSTNLLLHSEVVKNNILLIYKGNFTQEKLVPLFELLEENLVQHFEESAIKKRVYLTIIELLQNICKHAAFTNEQKEGVFMLAKKNRKYVLYATNFVKKTDCEKLNFYLVNSKNKTQEDLKKQFTQKLRDGFLDPEGNAGLGLLEISRHSEGNFTYQIEEHTKDLNYFTLTVKI